MTIDPSKVRPVPREDLERFKTAMREHVIKPMLERRKRQAEFVEAARKRVLVENLIRRYG